MRMLGTGRPFAFIMENPLLTPSDPYRNIIQMSSEHADFLLANDDGRRRILASSVSQEMVSAAEAAVNAGATGRVEVGPWRNPAFLAWHHL